MVRRQLLFGSALLACRIHGADPDSLVVLEYDLLVSGHNYTGEVASAYSQDGLGILAVVGA